LNLETGRLRLEPLQVWHADKLFLPLSDSRIYDFIAEAPPASISALRERYRRLAVRKSPDGTEDWLNWAVWSLPDRGYVGYVQATVHDDRSADIAYVVAPEHWGKGYGREAVGCMIEPLRHQYGVSLIRAKVDTRNSRSLALLGTLGFVCIAVRRDAELIRGISTDEAEYHLVD
jgi:ribosomal-protein-alanine N-acetyltransferase